MASSRNKFLMVDSDTRRAQDLALELQGRGMEVLSASEPLNAFFVVRKFQPEAVFINSELADGGAMVTLRRIRSNVYTTHIPVIIATPRDGANDRKYLAADAQECIPLPFSADNVHAAMQRHKMQSLDFTEAPAEVLAQPDRLAALYETSLLDSAPEESFDRLTRLASRLLGVGTALVSLVDKDRQFFKSQVGLPQPLARERQTRLSHSFCQWVVSGNEQLVVEDANEHPTLRHNRAVKDMGVIAYAGVPLSGRDGHVIGSFCAVDFKPRAWTEGDVQTLRDLSQVCESYAVRHREKRSSGAPSSGGPASMETSIHAAGKTILGVTRILRRCGASLGDIERADLLAIIEEQGEHLVALKPYAMRH